MSNAVLLNGELTLSDPVIPIPEQPALTTHFDDYLLTHTIPGQPITIQVTSSNTANFDPVIEVYQLGAGQNTPLPGQRPLAANDDMGFGNLNSLISPFSPVDVTLNGVPIPSGLTGDGVSRYLVRVISFDQLPSVGFPQSRTLPASYQIQANVPLGDIALQPSGGGGTPNPNTGTVVHRFYDWMANLHFYTANPAEIAFAQSLPDPDGPAGIHAFRDEGNSFRAPSDGNAAVLRFLNPATGTRFYTSAATDINNANSLGFVNEGVAFNSYNFPAPGSIPVYRFVDIQRFNQTGEVVHFFTPNESERANVEGVLSQQWRFEGVGFYAVPV